ncbi:MAG: Hpt domain-containing protein [Gemmatimonadales bacterium]
MGVPSGRIQFFVLEASDYLERLAILADRRDGPDGEELVRLTRALRGAALMAGLTGYAQAAAGLEQVAKAHRDDPSAWGPARASLLADAVESLQGLTRRAADWNEQDAERAGRLARELASAVGSEQVSPRPAGGEPSDELKPSVRAFVGREGALIGGTLEHAAQTLELGQPAEAATLVLGRLQPLRGLAALPSLSPLPEFLDAIELTIRSFRDQAPPPSGPAALRRVAAAVTRLAREIAEGGTPGFDAPEVVLGAVSLLETFGNEDDVVDVATLFRTGDPNPIVKPGERTGRDAAGDGMIELVSLGDRLRQAAEQVAAPGSATGRTLYLYGLLVQLRPLSQSAPEERPYLSSLLGAIAGAIGQGRAGRDPIAFAALLRDGAETLAVAASNRNAIFLEEELAPTVSRLQSLGRSAAEPERDETVVPIEALAPAEPLPPAVAVVPAPAAGKLPAGLNSFEQSFSTYHELVSAAGPTAPPAAESNPAAADAAPPAAAPTTDDETDVVPIESLLFRGRRALEQADRVRRELSDALAAKRPFAEVEPLVGELIDLVPLALAE